MQFVGCKGATLAALSALMFISIPTVAQPPHQRDYVQNAETAVAIAEAVLIPVYGRQKIESERPYKAVLGGDVWRVSGTLYCPNGEPQSESNPTCAGGVAVVELSKHDAHIISMTHYK
jgi:NTF2 fold immunity protein